MALFSILFLLPLIAFPLAETRCECLNSIVPLLRESDYRIISSPDYPRYYCPSLDCSWKLVAPDNYTVIKFYSNNLDLRHGKDFVYFYNYDNAKPNVEPDMHSYSCTGMDECDFTSSGQYLTIRFISAEGEPDRYGFQGTAALQSPYRQRMALLYKYKMAGGLGLLAFIIVVVGGTVLLFCVHKARSRKRSRNSERLAKNKLIEQ